MGSGEFQPWVGAAELAAMADARGDGSVAIFTTASAPEGEAVFQRWNSMGLAHYASLHLPARLIEVRSRVDADDRENARAARAASLVFFSGGNPRYLRETLAETRLLAAIEEMLAAGGVYAGCSAGAMVAGAQLPTGRGLARFAWGQGLGLVRGHVFGVHWDAAMMRPFRAVVAGRVPPDFQFLGIAERTAVLSSDQGWLVSGEGDVEQRGVQGRRRYRAGETISF
ncbi:MAG: Type 1 glutamine amidotransferase-like domain-containing protein [Candidatus Dormibacteria bacterium]